MSSDNSKANLIAQSLSAAAVVLSLVFVGLEVRESGRQTALNTRSVQASAYQELIGRILDFNEANVARPELIITISRALFDSLPEDEQRQRRSIVVARFRFGDLAYYQYELGMLTEERLESAIRPATGPICSWLFLEVWSDMKDNFVSSYRQFIDDIISDNENCREIP